MRWFTSDLHLGDPWTARMRYCKDDVAKQDGWLAARWDTKIAASDEVWVLGDVCRHPDGLDYVAAWLHQRPGTKHLVMGNWDHALSSDPWHWLDVGFSTVYSDVAHIELDAGCHAALCHYPDRPYPQGLVLLHGHTHRRKKITDRGIVHVGWEAWRRYVPEPDVLDALAESEQVSA